MARTLKIGIKELVRRASVDIEEVTAAEAIALMSDPTIQLVDIRDPRELDREGRVPGAFHCPRGMLEFWIDPESPYYKPIFGENKRFILFCGGGMRSALATKTAKDMGLEPVAHIIGGFAAWKEAGGPIETGPKIAKPQPQ